MWKVICSIFIFFMSCKMSSSSFDEVDKSKYYALNSAAIPGVDPWTYGGIALDLLTFVVNILPRDGATGMLLHFSM